MYDLALEDEVQQKIRLEASALGVKLFRNNIGAFTDSTGRTVRYGLANDSARISQNLKSSDLIGLVPVTVTPRHVGQTLGVFVAIECKKEGWDYRKLLTAREQAQKNFIDLINSQGGVAGFANSVESFRKIVFG